MDYSTLNHDELMKLPAANIPPSYRLDRSMGSGCFGDPPGYPTYFIQNVSTQAGNSPGRDGVTTAVIRGRAISSVGNYLDDRAPLMDLLWKPLPLEHPRVQAWIRSRFSHHRTHYLHPSMIGEYGRDRASFFWSEKHGVPSHSLRTFTTDESATRVRKVDQWIIDSDPELAAKAQQLEEDRVKLIMDKIYAEARALATPDNHCAVVYIRKHYPDYEPDLDLIDNPPSSSDGNWWEVEAERPTPETCKPPRWGGLHPMNGKWCQHCGWHEEEEEEKDAENNE